jgi:carbamoyl-phosphate synthase large subunit
MVDTCAGEFPAATPYLYSSYEDESEAPPSERPKIVILGSGPNRIGQGIEFDYCCVQAALALRDDGFETIMVNSNPETVSTDFDISDKLYFEPLTLEDVLEIVEREKPHGVIVQLGGQTPLKLAKPLADLGVPILGTSVSTRSTARRTATASPSCAAPSVLRSRPTASLRARSRRSGRRRSRLSGAGASVVRAGRTGHGDRLRRGVAARLLRARRTRVTGPPGPGRPLPRGRVRGGRGRALRWPDVVIAGVMQHIEDAGVHSGDSACVLPPYRLKDAEVEEMRRLTRLFAQELGVVGLINVQFAIRDGTVYVLEVNPRASRTVPFVSKATGVPFARLAASVMGGKTIAELAVPNEPEVKGVAVKEAVFPFNKFDVDVLLGPEMRSTGEVMGIDESFGMAFAKAQISTGVSLPAKGTVAVTVNDSDKAAVTAIIRRFHDLGFRHPRDRRHGEVPACPRHPRRADLQGRRRPAAHRRRADQRRDRSADQHAHGQEVTVRRLRDAAGGDHAQGAVLHHTFCRVRGRRGRDRPARADARSAQPPGAIRHGARRAGGARRRRGLSRPARPPRPLASAARLPSAPVLTRLRPRSN